MPDVKDVNKTRLAMLGGLLAAGIVLAACGGGTSHAAGASTGAPTTAGGAGRGAALTAFRDCMSSHGVTLAVPNGRGNGNGGPPSTTPGETRPARTPGSGPGGFGGFGGNFANRFNTPPAGVDPTKYKDALAACRSKLPTGGFDPQNNTAFRAYRSCLKDHGVSLPTSGSGSINRNDPKVKAALTTCQPLLPAGGFGRGGNTTTTTSPA